MRRSRCLDAKLVADLWAASLFIVALAIVLASASPVAPAQEPQRIVSANIASHDILLALAPERLVTVSPPVERLKPPHRPERPDGAWLVVQGDADEHDQGKRQPCAFQEYRPERRREHL